MNRWLFAVQERARLRLHFARVLAALRRAPVRPDGPRERALRRLRDYALDGRFPRHGGSGPPRPVFVDDHGTRCAVAHLLESAGRTDLVSTISSRSNHALVPELTAFLDRAALDEIGVSEREAAWIQPTYEPMVPLPPPCTIVLALQLVAMALTAAPVLIYLRLIPGYRDPSEALRDRSSRPGRELLVVLVIGLLLSTLVFPGVSPVQRGRGCGYLWSVDDLGEAYGYGWGDWLTPSLTFSPE